MNTLTRHVTLAAILMVALTAKAGGVSAQDGATESVIPHVPHVETIAGKDGRYFFYKGLDYGTQSLIHPRSMARL